MIEECRGLLVNTLKEIGIKGEIYTSLSRLKTGNVVDFGAVFFETEKPVRSTERRVILKKNGEKARRFKLFDREIKFLVTIGAKESHRTEERYESFLSLLPKGISDSEENWVELEIEQTDWVDRNDSILHSELAVQILVIFRAGLYRDKNLIRIEEVETQDEIGKE